MAKDKSKLKILNLNKMSYPIIYCPYNCNGFLGSGYKLIKKINQSKFVYKCNNCKRNFIVIIKLPLVTCTKCNIVNYNDHLFFNVKPCSKCNNTGVLTWIENIFGRDDNQFNATFANMMGNIRFKRVVNQPNIFTTGV